MGIPPHRPYVLFFATALVVWPGSGSTTDASCGVGGCRKAQPATSGAILLQKRAFSAEKFVEEEEENEVVQGDGIAAGAAEDKWFFWGSEDDGSGSSSGSGTGSSSGEERPRGGAVDDTLKSQAGEGEERSRGREDESRGREEEELVPVAEDKGRRSRGGASERKQKKNADKEAQKEAAEKKRQEAAANKRRQRELKEKEAAANKVAMAKRAEANKARKEFCKQNPMECFDNSTMVEGIIYVATANEERFLHSEETLQGLKDGIADFHSIPSDDVAVVLEWVNVSLLPKGTVEEGKNIAIKVAYEILVPETESAQTFIDRKPARDAIVTKILNEAEEKEGGDTIDATDSSGDEYEAVVEEDGLSDHIPMTIPPPGIKKGVILGWPKEKQCGDLNAHNSRNVGWFYNWRPNVSSKGGWHTPECRELLKQYEYVPMIQNGADMDEETFASTYVGSGYLLPFNEPYGPKTDMSPHEALGYMPRIVALKERLERQSGRKIQLGSPSVNPKDEAMHWITEFMHLAEAKGIEFDFMSVHCYQMDVWGLRKGLNMIWNTWKKPLWLTEFNYGDGPADASAEEQLAFMKKVLPMLEAHPKVVRYSWMASRGPTRGSHLVMDTEDGPVLTTLGKFYNGVTEADDDYDYYGEE